MGVWGSMSEPPLCWTLQDQRRALDGGMTGPRRCEYRHRECKLTDEGARDTVTAAGVRGVSGLSAPTLVYREPLPERFRLGRKGLQGRKSSGHESIEINRPTTHTE